MKSYLLLIFLLLFEKNLGAQNALPLNTPSYWLKEARIKANLKDTVGAIVSMENSIATGLFDVQAITGSKPLSDLLLVPQKEKLTKDILSNRNKIKNPSAIKIITDDLDRFWTLFPLIGDSMAENIFLNEYIAKGSVGLRTFYQVRMNSSLNAFIDKLRTTQSYYTSIKEISRQFKTMRPQFVAAANKLETLYPESIFPPIFFLMGNLNNVGTADGYAGLLIGTEHLCRYDLADTSQLTSIDKLVLFDTSLAVPLIVHEYVHFQQKNKPERTLLEYAIMEGVADFITYLVTGKYTNPEVYKFGLKNEQAIWKKFSAEYAAENTDDWLFNTFNPLTGFPGNLGYFVGFRICESYYRVEGNKRDAINDLLEIKDFNKFLIKSAYKAE